ncbi:Macrolide export ATP-binding/permease protein MacB [Dyadobacter sp. CECT 9623]|uniref:Macrolide export ATP-binding/permease protein MacB n=1 Tax=Dyadobacter linearis TaxID=2823330 RepID=A0ABN7R878_9BACT|nr:ABC transporter permease [Dyadobacter sp. CECT 9623]CAG5067932.1 Macrolide export ATP-binding/permease protein MacB [Dyadobacter sp. CECT 9623]
MNIRENVDEGLRSIQSNLLRTVLTALIIAIGITSLVGILTAIEGIQSSVNSSFADLGANTFTVRNRYDDDYFSRGRRSKKYPAINYREARSFAETFRSTYADAKVSLSADIAGAVQVNYQSKKTNPNSSVVGSDDQYLGIKGYKIDQGRNIDKNDMEKSLNVAVLGQEVARKLFERADPINKEITFMGSRYKVIGVLQKKGSLGGDNDSDRIIVIPLENGRGLAANQSLTYNTTASAPTMADGDLVVEEARGIMRRLRHDPLGKEDSFEIDRADAMAKDFEEVSGYLRLGGFGIGIITLLGASIALMNIMLVSVTERTREIGIRKSLGATPSVIRFQFLIEAIVVCILGGIGGLFLGIIIGNIISTSISTDSTFVVPWLWMAMGIAVCVFVGVISGIYPAIKASRLDPIEALRYE